MKKVSSGAIDLIKKNKIVSLISDAGTPTISDPGMIIVNRCIEEKLDVHPIPGPSAVTSAMSVSGFNDKYLFYGFLSKKENELDKTLNNLQNLNFPIVFFVPAAKINFFLKKFKKYFFDRKILVAKEMTKIHEQLIREKIESIEPFSKNLKGELTIVLSDKIKEQKYQKKLTNQLQYK